MTTRLIRVEVDLPSPDQLELGLDEDERARQREATIQEAFERFHAENPDVYDELLTLARRWRTRGNQRAGIAMFFEVLRYRRGMRTQGDDFKLNNNYRSRYSRKIMAENPDLAGIFDTRELHS